MEKHQETCIKKVSSLLAENKLKEAFNLLDEHLLSIGVSTDLSSYFVSASSQFHRMEKEYRLGTISWEQYNIASSQIVVKALELTKNICSYKWKLIPPPINPIGGYKSTSFDVKNKGMSNKPHKTLDEIRKEFEIPTPKRKDEIEKSYKELIQEILKLKPKN